MSLALTIPTAASAAGSKTTKWEWLLAASVDRIVCRLSVRLIMLTSRRGVMTAPTGRSPRRMTAAVSRLVSRRPSVAPENAPDSTPISVMPICTVERNFPGSDASASARREPLTFLNQDRHDPEFEVEHYRFGSIPARQRIAAPEE